MDLQQVLHMTGGVGQTSYAENSIFQKIVISKAKPFVEKAIIELYGKTIPRCFTMADLGCSSGPNSFFLISDIINTIDTVRKKMGHQLPEFQVFLNDRPRNDFNTLFVLITKFYEQLRKSKGDDFRHCYIAGMPGSFYERLFPSNTLLFVHSSYSGHWLSQVPQGIENNKGNIYMAMTSPQNVFDAYAKQFSSDFSSFLRLRYEEIVSGGRMVITVVGRRSFGPSSRECCRLWELLAKSLCDMVAEDLVEEAKLDLFNMPYYNPNGVEITNIIEREGSFHLDLLESFDVNWDATDDPQNEDFVFNKRTSGQNVAKCIRAVTESLLASHFGEEIIEDLFHRFAEYVSEQLVKDKIKHVNLVMCMTKK